jgi:hypothetical protein
VIIFGSIRFLSKKVTKPNFFFFKKTENEQKTGSNRPVLVWFGFLGKKPVQIGLARFFRFWLGFFPVSVRFGFFDFLLIKPNRTKPAGFFKIIIGLIGVFFGYFFSSFLSLIGFSVFFSPLLKIYYFTTTFVFFFIISQPNLSH